jgi:hypothetical protein
MRFIPGHCGVRKVRLVPTVSRALPATFLRGRLEIIDFTNIYKSIKG